MTETEEKINALAEALKQARTAAEVYATSEDGGMCNFDTATIKLPRWKYEDIKTACKNVGLRCSVWNSYNGKRYHIFGYEDGQANRRTKMAETFCKTLENLGYDTMMYYAID